MGYRLGGMNIAEIANETAGLTLEQKRRFLARLAFELTIAARDTYVPGWEEIAAPRQLRGFNEMQHLVTSNLLEILGTGKDDIWVLQGIADLARGAGITTEVAYPARVPFGASC
jgi:hypothetical protein